MSLELQERRSTREFGYVFDNRLAKCFEIVSALETRHDAAAANFVGPLFNGGGLRNVIGIFEL